MDSGNSQAPGAKEIWRGLAVLLGSDLRTPLALIHGYTELIQDGTAGPLTEEQERYLDIIYARIETIGRLVDDGTRFALIQAGQIYSRTERLNLSVCAREIVEDLHDNIEAKRQRLIIELPKLLLVRADHQQLVEILTELLENAHRYTPAEGRINLTAERQGNSVRVLIADSGIGIAPEDLSHIFEPWFRGRNTVVLGRHGVGTGLYVAKYYIEQLGGEIGFTSELGQGSTFWFTLPVAEGVKATNIDIGA